MYKVSFTQVAEKDLFEAADYISTILKSPAAAGSLMEIVENQLTLLEALPYSFPEVKDAYLATEGIRLAVVNNYLLFYTVNEIEQSVTVIRFLSGRRNWATLLEIEDA